LEPLKDIKLEGETKMKKSIVTLSTLTLAFITIVFCISMDAGAQEKATGWELPYMNAEMEVITAQGAFEEVETVFIDVTRQVGSKNPTGVYLNYDLSSDEGEIENKTVALNIIEILDAGCGSVQYIARLAAQKDEDYGYNIGLGYFDNNARPIEHRFSVVITDHTKRTCRDVRRYQWEASVREGYGWCGTMDDTMSLVGNPEKFRLHQ
jgi:hypothetical protein